MDMNIVKKKYKTQYQKDGKKFTYIDLQKAKQMLKDCEKLKLDNYKKILVKK